MMRWGAKGKVMKAFMSDAGGRPIAGKVDRLRFSGQSEQFITAAAVREAERIVAEAERPEDVAPLGDWPQHNSHDGWPLVWADDPTDADSVTLTSAHHLLADSLRAILPVLDELATDATRAAAGSQHKRADYCATLWMRDRNRATLAAMDARPVCTNCGQWQHGGDCFNECARRGFAQGAGK